MTILGAVTAPFSPPRPAPVDGHQGLDQCGAGSSPIGIARRRDNLALDERDMDLRTCQALLHDRNECRLTCAGAFQTQLLDGWLLTRAGSVSIFHVFAVGLRSGQFGTDVHMFR